MTTHQDHISRLSGLSAHAVSLICLCLAAANRLPAQTSTIDGHFHSTVSDARRPGVAARQNFFVTTDAGKTFPVDLDAGMLARAGGERALVGRRVQISGTGRLTSDQPGRGVIRASDIRVVAPTAPAAPMALNAVAARGPSPYVTILCKFGDSVSVEPRSKSAYEELLLGTKYPDLQHAWSYLTAGYINLSGSRVVGWYVLPHPKAYYFATKQDGTPDIDAGAHQDLMQQDCLDAADPDVDFNLVSGINVQLNGSWGFATGGSWWVTRDGAARVIPMTWEPSWAGAFVYLHETGHSIGLPHSTGPYDDGDYTSHWDFMSHARFWEATLKDDVPGGTIAYHQRRIGALSAEDELVPTSGRRTTVALDFINTPTHPGTGARMVTLPIGGTVFYTLESRQKSGPYDKWIPGSGVVVFRVDTAPPLPGKDWTPARVVDVDNNHDVNDAATYWTPGETWTDPISGYSFTVSSETAAGYNVSVRRGFAETIAIRGRGTITSGAAICAQSPCEYIVASSGQSVSFQAVPAAGEQFLGWTSGCAPTVAACTRTLSRDETITARFGRPVVIKTSTVRTGITGRAFADTLRADGGIDGIAWELASGALPSGLSLASSGVVTGTPTKAGVVNITVRAKSDELVSTQALIIEVEAPVTVSSNATRPTALAAAPYADTVRATGGGVSGLRWRLVSGKLPTGVTLSTGGVLSGNVVEAGDYQAVLAVESDVQHVEQSFTWRALGAFAIASQGDRPHATMGASYRDVLASTPAMPGLTWSVASGVLPTGVVVDAATGTISGVPEQTGTFAFAVQAQATLPNIGAVQAQSSLSVTVDAPSVAATSLLDHLVGASTLSPDIVRYFDLLGNRNGRLDVGDIAAWLKSTGQLNATNAALFGITIPSVFRP